MCSQPTNAHWEIDSSSLKDDHSDLVYIPYDSGLYFLIHYNLKLICTNSLEDYFVVAFHDYYALLKYEGNSAS